MVSEHDIDQTLENTTLDGNQTEEIAVRISIVVAAAVNAQISIAMNEWFCCLQTTPANMILSPFPSSAPPRAAVGNLRTSLSSSNHAGQSFSTTLSNLYALPPIGSAANTSYHSKVRNPQIHLTIEVGESLARSNPNVQASSSSSSSIAHHQLEGLRQQIATIEATLGATSNTPGQAFIHLY
ncbi:uncharacterized protein E5676_scaffold432G00040 [Cucumis melo var. makuwa]|uniref:Kirola-like n=1 Tax=Cucumis melo var. makuwa TaxID=1194695 RepID=A0A5D3C1P7_CUCMM|nr:uncharacterized protein E5676_scaffold432G00040 [Cucumis melo var. makuwa]